MTDASDGVSVSLFNGRVKLSVVAAFAFAIGFFALAYLNYYQYSRNQQSQAMMQSQITDLNYQVKVDHESATPTASPGPTSGTPMPTPSPTPQVAGASTFSVPEFGVQFTIAGAIYDLSYQMLRSGYYKVAEFTTKSLTKQYPSCGPGVLGGLVKKSTDYQSGNDQPIRSLSGYYYFYVSPDVASSCAGSGQATVQHEQAAVLSALKTSLK